MVRPSSGSTTRPRRTASSQNSMETQNFLRIVWTYAVILHALYPVVSVTADVQAKCGCPQHRYAQSIYESARASACVLVPVRARAGACSRQPSDQWQAGYV